MKTQNIYNEKKTVFNLQYRPTYNDKLGNKKSDFERDEKSL